MVLTMLAKLTSKNQLTLPKAAVEAAGAPEYFEIEVSAGRLLLTPVRLQRANAVRGKLAELGLDDNDLGAAVEWARRAAGAPASVRVSEKRGSYDAAKPAKRPSRKRGK